MNKLGIAIFIAVIIIGAAVTSIFSFGSLPNIPAISLFSKVRGSGNVIEQRREVSNFTGVVVSNAINVEAKFGPEYSVVVKTDDNLQDIIVTELRGDKLSIYSDGRYSSTAGVTVVVTSPKLNYVKGSGAANIDLSEVNGDTLYVRLSGASKLNVSGTIESIKIKTNGASVVDGFGLTARDAYVTSSGASHSKVNVTGLLNVKASGASNIEYKGEPANIEKRLSGASSLDAR